MTADKKLPLSGYAIEQVYSNYLALSNKKPNPKSVGDAEIGLGWDWRLLDEKRFEVALLVNVEPSQQRDENITVRVVGRFRQVAAVPTVAREDFVGLQATSILLPYARHLLSMLTLQSFHGPFYLPPVNVAQVMKDFDSLKTSGAKQLAGLKALPKPDVNPAPPTPKRSARRRESSKGKTRSAK